MARQIQIKHLANVKLKYQLQTAYGRPLTGTATANVVVAAINGLRLGGVDRAVNGAGLFPASNKTGWVLLDAGMQVVASRERGGLLLLH